MINKLLIFELVGKLACWKKFYSNSSSFTYEIPPRTALTGIIGSILEMPRDSYYDKLSFENCKISLAVNSKVKRRFNCINYFQKPNERKYTQVRLELLSPINLQEDNLSYLIYIYLKNDELFNELVKKIKAHDYGFGIYLGQRQFRGNTNFIATLSKEDISEINDSKEISSIVNLKNVNSREDFVTKDVCIEKMPLNFSFIGKPKEEETNLLNRELVSIGDIAYSPSKKIETKDYFKKALKITYNNNEENIAFFEDDF